MAERGQHSRLKMSRNRLIELINLLELNIDALIVPIADGMDDDFFNETMYIVEIIRDTVENIKEELE